MCEYIRVLEIQNEIILGSRKQDKRFCQFCDPCISNFISSIIIKTYLKKRKYNKKNIKNLSKETIIQFIINKYQRVPEIQSEIVEDSRKQEKGFC